LNLNREELREPQMEAKRQLITTTNHTRPQRKVKLLEEISTASKKETVNQASDADDSKPSIEDI
jgi:hypothetical protein